MSALELALGMACAIAVGITVGGAVARVAPVRSAVQPWIAALNASPMIALAPVVVLWFGLGIQSKIFVVALIAVFPIIVNTEAGIRETDRDLIEMARALRLPQRKIVLDIYLRSALPVMVAGIRLGTSNGIIGVVVGELFGAKAGLGYAITTNAQLFDVSAMFLAIGILALAGILLTGSLRALERRMVPWRPRYGGRYRHGRRIRLSAGGRYDASGARVDRSGRAPGRIVTVVGPSGSQDDAAARAGRFARRARVGPRARPRCHRSRPAHRGRVQNDRLLPWRSVANNGSSDSRRRACRATSSANAWRTRCGWSVCAVRPTCCRTIVRRHAATGEPRARTRHPPGRALDGRTVRRARRAVIARVRARRTPKICSLTRASAVFVTHQIDEAVYLGDRVVVLSGQPCTVAETLTVPFGAARARSRSRPTRAVELVARVWSQVKAGALAHWERDLVDVIVVVERIAVS